MKSQKQLVLEHLQSDDPNRPGHRRTISPLEALGLFNIYRLADVIFKLKAAGHYILSDLRLANNGKRYARYTMPRYRYFEDPSGLWRWDTVMKVGAWYDGDNKWEPSEYSLESFLEVNGLEWRPQELSEKEAKDLTESLNVCPQL